jgi:hypothetical protein
MHIVYPNALLLVDARGSVRERQAEKDRKEQIISTREIWIDEVKMR